MLPEFFKVFEEDLQEKIAQGNVPYISLYAQHILPSTQQKLTELFAKEHDLEDITFSFSKFPALTISYLTAAIGNNDTETMQIWKPIATAFGLGGVDTKFVTLT